MSRINSAEIIDVDAECNRPRQIPFRREHPQSTPTIDLTNLDDSDSDISFMKKPGERKGKELNHPSAIGPAIEKIRVRTFEQCSVPHFLLLSETPPTCCKFI